MKSFFEFCQLLKQEQAGVPPVSGVAGVTQPPKVTNQNAPKIQGPQNPTTVTLKPNPPTSNDPRTQISPETARAWKTALEIARKQGDERVVRELETRLGLYRVATTQFVPANQVQIIFHLFTFQKTRCGNLGCEDWNPTTTNSKTCRCGFLSLIFLIL